MARRTKAHAEKNLEVFRVMLGANIPVKLESLPGAGKTSLINGAFRASNGFLRTMVAVNHDPTDFGGMPKTFEDFYRLVPGEWAVELVQAVQTYPIVGLFLDEVNTGGRAVLASLLKVVDERIVGFLRLPPEIRVILAMNPAEANGGVDLTPAMANRVSHLPFEFPLAWWADMMRTGFKDGDPIIIPNADDLTAAELRYGALIADFSQSGAASKFEEYPDDVAERSKAFPTRRTWTLSARALAAAELMGYDSMVQRLALESLVGKRSAEEFEDWRDSQNGMDPEAMLNAPDTFPLPERDDALFTALDRMVAVALQNPTQGYIDGACTILIRVGVDRPGVAAAGMRNVALFLRENRNFISPKVQEAIRLFKPVIDAAGGMGLD